jgi:hypothetical protein
LSTQSRHSWTGWQQTTGEQGGCQQQ